MQENNFEKQVQEKMDDLRIDPSGELWQKVSSRIGKKKRDHRVLLACLSSLQFPEGAPCDRFAPGLLQMQADHCYWSSAR